MQTLLSIIGLAVGFVCFVLSLVWIRYEMSYDSFHKDAERIFALRAVDKDDNSVRIRLSGSLASYLQEVFPEVEVGCIADPSRGNEDILTIDSAFLSIFPLQVLAGNTEFVYNADNRVALSRSFANKLFPGEEPLGNTLESIGYPNFVVSAVVGDLPAHTSLPADILMSVRKIDWMYSRHIVLKLKPGVDVEEFNRKLAVHEIVAEGGRTIRNLRLFLVPLPEIRYNYSVNPPDIRLEHIYYFVAVGLFVIVCSLINTITLLITRFYGRQREMALRIISGSGRSGLVALLVTEFILILLLAIIAGGLLTELLLPSFLKVADINLSSSAFWGKVAFWYGLAGVLALLLFTSMAYGIRDRSLSTSLKRGAGNIVGKVGIVTQLIFSILLIFCTVVINKQLNYLFSTDLGFEFERRGSIQVSRQVQAEEVAHILLQIPGIEETVTGSNSLLPKMMGRTMSYAIRDGEVAERNIRAEFITFSPEYMNFYALCLLEGRLPEVSNEILVNETMVKEIGWKEIIDKQIYKDADYKVVGIVKDAYYDSPLTPPGPVVYEISEGGNFGGKEILFRYGAGSWHDYRLRIEEALKDEIGLDNPRIYNAEEAYKNFIRSEKMLLGVLSVVSLACVIISLFGVYSLVALACEKRRKEIAIRKINGAEIRNILRMFAYEYIVLLGISAVVAFPVGYLIMNYWLQQYVKRVSVGMEVYLGIFLLLLLLMALCTGWKVWRAAVVNPAEVVKSE